MAGIGFALRKLTEENSILSLFHAYIRASIVIAGPWLMTVLTLAIVMIFGKELLPYHQALSFQSIIIYNFAFSVVLTAPISLTATRYLADRIYAKDVSCAPGMIVGVLILSYLLLAPLAFTFYFMFVNITPLEAFLSSLHFLLLSTVWLVAIYLTALHDYDTITKAFVIGFVLGLGLIIYGSLIESVAFMLFGFNIGLAIIVAYILLEVLAEYPYPYASPFGFFQAFVKYKELALSGLIYNGANWIDKWVMWSSPEAVTLPNNLVLYPHYDLAAFLAYFITIPAMAYFLVSLETDFFEKYIQFYEEIKKGATFKKITQNQELIQTTLFREFRGVFILQGALALLVITMAPILFEWLYISFSLLGIFRFCVVGASYQVFLLFLSFVLWYFDARKTVLLIQTLFLILNFVCTLGSLYLGFPYYGLGFAVSAMVSFLIAAFLAYRHLSKLPYHTFITNNASIEYIQ